MLLSEKYPETKTELFLLLKFSKEVYLKKIQDGSIYTRIARHYAEREAVEGKKGLGDAYEASVVYSNVNLTFKDPETQQVLGTGFTPRLLQTDNDLIDCNIFCLTGINGDMLEIISEDEETIEVRVFFTEEQKRRFVEDFGVTDVLVIYPSEFLRLFHTAANNLDVPVEDGFVQYDDFKINSKKRIESIQEDTLNVFFWKDQSIAYQNEFRLVFQLPELQDPFTLEIGEIHASTHLLSYDQLVHNGELKMTIKK